MKAMKLISRILLGISGSIALLTVVSSLLSLLLDWIIFIINLLYHVLLIILMLCKVDPSLIKGMMVLLYVTDPIVQILLELMGATSTEAIASNALVGYFIVDIFFGVAISLVNTVIILYNLALFLLISIFSFIGMGKKKHTGIHIFDVILGFLCYYYMNVLIGTAMTVGGVFGVITDFKMARAEEAKEEKEERELKLANSEVSQLTLVDNA